jgi:putative RNA 2'-phosphotransferase
LEKNLKHISKLMSLVLRHQPEEIGLHLNENGWANVEELIQKINQKGIIVDHKTLTLVVETNDKKRFAFNEEGTMIRASQGHSIAVELNLQPIVPPAFLYHGTTARFMESILRVGLQKQSRQHVHLSATLDTALTVGSRHGKPRVLTIRAAAMHAAGYPFFLSENLVWLTEHVPVEYIII